MGNSFRESKEHYSHLTGDLPTNDWTVFFTYGENHEHKSMAIVKAKNTKEAGEKVRNTINPEDYPNVHIWWIETVENMYGDKEIIIP